jgi:hypothetical protein
MPTVKRKCVSFLLVFENAKIKKTQTAKQKKRRTLANAA